MLDDFRLDLESTTAPIINMMNPSSESVVTDSNEEALEVPLDMFIFSDGHQDVMPLAEVPNTESFSQSSPSTKCDDAQTASKAASNLLPLAKHFFSCALLIFSIVMVGAAIFERQTTATGKNSLPPAAAFVIFWTLLLYLAQLEGGLNVMVGLKHIDPALYAQSHPRTFGCTKLAHKGGNLDRFIVGRQYLDLTMVFTTSYMVSTIDGASVLGLPQIVCNIFLDSGLAVTLITIVIGQLIAMINSTDCMLDFVNNYLMLASTYLALTVEATGILHTVYFIQIVVGKFAGAKASPVKLERTTIQKITFWIRVAFSVTIVLFTVIITVKAIFDGKTTLWKKLPPYMSIILLVIIILIAGIMEGLQIAFMAVVHMPEEKLNHHPNARRNCDYIFSSNNRLQAFLNGRQICQTIIMFVFARITTLDVEVSEDNIFGIPDGLQKVLNSGVLTTLMATIIASLTWRVMANTFPLAFLGCPLSRPILDLCLLVEATGICYISWFLATVHRKVAGFKTDEFYLGQNLQQRVSTSRKSLDKTELSSVSDKSSDTDEALDFVDI